MAHPEPELTPPERADLERLLWLARMVRDMRRHQRDYFKFKQPADLRASKDLERRVDEAVTLFLDPRQAVLPLGGPTNASLSPSLPRPAYPQPHPDIHYPPEPLDPRD